MQKKRSNLSHHNENSSNKTGSVRIISGRHRGRKLPVLTAEGLRPTGDRVKETLFNWLMGAVRNARCLDCFAGSGALGFEALSRDANFVLFLEKDKQVANQLRANLRTLATPVDRALVQTTDSLQFLQQPPQMPFNLVFLDPPFHFGLAEKALLLLEQYQWLADKALVYVETEKKQPLALPAHWVCLKEKTTGQVAYRLYEYHQMT